MGLCKYLEESNIGILNIVKVPLVVEVFLVVIFLDFIIYWQHRFFHNFSVLWRFHSVHHSDRDLDTTSALRFHPIEILISVGVKVFFIVLLGASSESVLFFEIVLNFMAMFNHSNLGILEKLEKFIRNVFVTPQMHIIHHSVNLKESNMNFGFNFSIWDKIFSTYRPHFSGSKVIGESSWKEKETTQISFLLTRPFRRK